jgi:hypothetical protein
VREPIETGTVVGIETADALLLAEVDDSCRWGLGIQVSLKLLQVIPFRSDLHNLVAAVNSRGVTQAHGTATQARRA